MENSYRKLSLQKIKPTEILKLRVIFLIDQAIIQCISFSMLYTINTIIFINYYYIKCLSI